MDFASFPYILQVSPISCFPLFNNFSDLARYTYHETPVSIFLQLPVTASLLGPDTFLSTLI